MNSIAPNALQNKLDIAAAVRADRRVDAEQGWALFHQQEAQRYQQGWAHAKGGADFDDVTLWSTQHVLGFTAYHEQRRAPVFISAGGGRYRVAA